jgi:hypothetical protein
LYAVTSNNYSGVCCSIRWFVPFLAPGYYVLAILLRHRPDAAADLTILSAGGIMVGLLMWREGPWMVHLVPFFWPIQGAALLSWGVYRWRRNRRPSADQLSYEMELLNAATPVTGANPPTNPSARGPWAA